MHSEHAYYEVGSDSDTVLADDEKHFEDSPRQMRPLSRSGRLVAKVRSSFWRIVEATSLAAIIGLLIAIYRDLPRNTELQIGGDVAKFMPKFSQQIVTFKPESEYLPETAAEWKSAKVQSNWLGLVPKGLGYVQVKDPEKHDNLPTPLQGEFIPPNMTVFTTSMTHQLHCLYNIIDLYYTLTANPPMAIPSETPWHTRHCFDYLRQAIMCTGDVALEGTQTTFPVGFEGSDGWDAKHVCKNYKQVHDYLEEKRADDKVWI